MLQHALDLVAMHDSPALLALAQTVGSTDIHSALVSPVTHPALIGPALAAGVVGTVAVSIGDSLLAQPQPFAVAAPAATRTATALRTRAVWQDRRTVVVGGAAPAPF